MRVERFTLERVVVVNRGALESVNGGAAVIDSTFSNLNVGIEDVDNVNGREEMAEEEELRLSICIVGVSPRNGPCGHLLSW